MDATKRAGKEQGMGKSGKEPRALGPGWVSRAWKRAQAEMGKVDDQLPAPEGLREGLKRIADPVERAREIARVSAPADMILLTAIKHLAPEVHEQFRFALQHTSSIALRSLSIVGLKAGETQELDVSDRMRDVLLAWRGAGTAAPAEARVIVEGESARLEEGPQLPS